MIQDWTPDFPRVRALARCLATAEGVLISSFLGQWLPRRLRLGCIRDYGQQNRPGRSTADAVLQDLTLICPMWAARFECLIGLTATGRATVEARQRNRPELVNRRKLLYAAGEHPLPDT